MLAVCYYLCECIFISVFLSPSMAFTGIASLGYCAAVVAQALITWPKLSFLGKQDVVLATIYLCIAGTCFNMIIFFLRQKRELIRYFQVSDAVKKE